MQSILSAQHVVKRYANHTALNDVSIEIPQQSIYGLLGPNGAGKTSLIRIINQITGPDEGTILFEGQRLSPKHIEQIGYLPEERGLYKKMKVGEQALYLAQLKGLTHAEAKKRLKLWFEKFEMGSWWDKKIEELSKGMQQKVQFIVTVLHEPKLLILDEPFSGFDPINADLIKNEIINLKKQGATILFSTHNMGSVEELCDNIALINRSQKILDGPVKEIRKQNKSSIYELTFKGTLMGFTNAMWAGAELVEHSTDEDINTARVKLVGKTTGNELLQAILPAVEVQCFREIIPSMNDIFISKVKNQNLSNSSVNLTE
ncbi:MAG TPA: ATP-binding cassette domain-containing protein [Bacteroidia bacterium]|jgi:ABC-2 type transport system ATP-binding protein|nr:ATP-binding cassette domain-containing protein [Bacteroidia bacterium]